MQHTQLPPLPCQGCLLKGVERACTLISELVEVSMWHILFAPIHTHSFLPYDMPMNFHTAATNACTNIVSRSHNTEGSDLCTAQGKSSTHRQGGMWWGRFLSACTAWGGSRWRRILPQLLTGQPSAGRARTAWLSVSPNGQKDKEMRLDSAWCKTLSLSCATFF